MKKFLFTIAAVILAALMLTSCVSDVDSTLQDITDNLNDDFLDYLATHEKYPQSVLDVLDLMLDNYVSGTATPPISSITPVIIPPGDTDSQTIISQVSSSPTSQAELEQLIYEAVKNLETEITFEAVGTWCTDEVLYEAIFDHVHDVYMIDAFGLNAYSYTATVNSDGNDVYQLDLIYLDGHSTSDIADMRNEIERAAKDALVTLNIGGKTDYEKIYAINQYLCDTVYYPDDPFIDYDFTPYGALVDGRAVCDGYARATKIIADMAGMECLYVSGDCYNAYPSGHAWNLVKVDGEWYQLDVTWNDGSSTEDYFLVTDDFMSISRTWDTADYPASAKSAYQP